MVAPDGITSAIATRFEKLAECLVHRGPDSSGRLEDVRVRIGMHRLSIIDVKNGDQPFHDESGLISVVENGEIYNASSLRDDLIHRGHVFGSRSDAEVVPHLYEEFGLEGIQKLQGMFAIAVLDRRNSKLHLIRDRMGEKPLYVTKTRDGVWFSSELRPLIQSQCTPAELEESSVAQYLLHGFVPEGAAFCGTEVVGAGEIWTIDLTSGNIAKREYWSPWEHIGSKKLTARHIADAIRDGVESACTSDVPVGIALSGGLDSAVVAAIASRRIPDLRAFTIGYDTPSSSDETTAASLTAAQLKLHHTRVTVQTSDVASDFRIVCSARDEPIADIAGPSYLALARAFQDAKVPVMLTGQGGDELFWGYPWVRNAAIIARGGFSFPARHFGRNFLAASHSRGAMADYLVTLGGGITARRMKRIHAASRDGLTSIPLFPASPGFGAIKRRAQGLLNGSNLQDPVLSAPVANNAELSPYFMIAIMRTYLRTNGLAQLDRLSMHHSIESRTPLVDHRIIELILSGQHESILYEHTSKQSFRDAARLLAPELVIAGPKRGFTPPIRRWMSAIWHQEQATLRNLALETTGLFDINQVRRVLKAAERHPYKFDHLAFRLLTLELWWRGLAS